MPSGVPGSPGRAGPSGHRSGSGHGGVIVRARSSRAATRDSTGTSAGAGSPSASVWISSWCRPMPKPSAATGMQETNTTTGHGAWAVARRGQQVEDHLAEQAEQQRADGGAEGELAHPLRGGDVGPDAQRVPAVGLHPDRQRDGGVQLQGVRRCRAAGGGYRTRIARPGPPSRTRRQLQQAARSGTAARYGASRAPSRRPPYVVQPTTRAAPLGPVAGHAERLESLREVVSYEPAVHGAATSPDLRPVCPAITVHVVDRQVLRDPAARASKAVMREHRHTILRNPLARALPGVSPLRLGVRLIMPTLGLSDSLRMAFPVTAASSRGFSGLAATNC